MAAHDLHPPHHALPIAEPHARLDKQSDYSAPATSAADSKVIQRVAPQPIDTTVGHSFSSRPVGRSLLSPPGSGSVPSSPPPPYPPHAATAAVGLDQLGTISLQCLSTLSSSPAKVSFVYTLECVQTSCGGYSLLKAGVGRRRYRCLSLCLALPSCRCGLPLDVGMCALPLHSPSFHSSLSHLRTPRLFASVLISRNVFISFRIVAGSSARPHVLAAIDHERPVLCYGRPKDTAERVSYNSPSEAAHPHPVCDQTTQ